MRGREGWGVLAALCATVLGCSSEPAGETAPGSGGTAGSDDAADAPAIDGPDEASGDALSEADTAGDARAPLTAWCVSRHSSPSDAKAQVSADFALIAELGARYVRTDFWWRSVEPSQGQMDDAALDYYDWYVDEAKAHGLGVVVILSGAEQWAKDLYAADPTAFFAELQAYADAVATRVGDRVVYYQLWNEPNHFIDWVDAADDPKLFVSLHDGIAAGDSEATTLINVIADGFDSPECPSWKCSVEDYLAAAGSSVDIIGLDRYPDTWAGGDWGDDLVDRLLALGKAHARPVALLEVGYSTASCIPAQNDEAGQPVWIHEQLPKIRAKLEDPAITQGSEMPLVNWFKLDDPDTSLDACTTDVLNTIEAHFGIVHTDRSKKPGWDALVQEIAAFE